MGGCSKVQQKIGVWEYHMPTTRTLHLFMLLISTAERVFVPCAASGAVGALQQYPICIRRQHAQNKHRQSVDI